MKKITKMFICTLVAVLISIGSISLSACSTASYTVSFDSLGGSEVSSVTVEKGKSLDEPAAPTKEGFTFQAWYDNSDLENEAVSFPYTPEEDITLYAKWTENETVCELTCSVCGGCLSSEHENCETKCGEGKTEYKFEGEDGHVILTGGDFSDLMIMKEKGATETYIGGFNANPGASIQFFIDVEEATTASLIVSVCRRANPAVYTNNVAVLVNGEMIDSPSVVATTGTGADTWVDFVDVNLGCISLNAGMNEIKLALMDTEVSAGFNFNCMKLLSSSPVVWYEEPKDPEAHECESVCADCGKCKDSACAEDVCSNKCDCDWTAYDFDGMNEKVDVFGGAGKTTENCIGVLNGNLGAGATFNLSAVNATTASIYLNACHRGSITRFSESFTFTVNGTEYTSNSLMPTGGAEWFDYEDVFVVQVPLAAGKNEITFTVKTDNVQKGYNIKKITLKTASEPISWFGAAV